MSKKTLVAIFLLVGAALTVWQLRERMNRVVMRFQIDGSPASLRFEMVGVDAEGSEISITRSEVRNESVVVTSRGALKTIRLKEEGRGFLSYVVRQRLETIEVPKFLERKYSFLSANDVDSWSDLKSPSQVLDEMEFDVALEILSQKEKQFEIVTFDEDNSHVRGSGGLVHAGTSKSTTVKLKLGNSWILVREVDDRQLSQPPSYGDSLALFHLVVDQENLNSIRNTVISFELDVFDSRKIVLDQSFLTAQDRRGAFAFLCHPQGFFDHVDWGLEPNNNMQDTTSAEDEVVELRQLFGGGRVVIFYPAIQRIWTQGIPGTMKQDNEQHMKIGALTGKLMGHVALAAEKSGTHVVVRIMDRWGSYFVGDRLSIGETRIDVGQDRVFDVTVVVESDGSFFVDKIPAGPYSAILMIDQRTRKHIDFVIDSEVPTQLVLRP